jgi:hypothetical protein
LIQLKKPALAFVLAAVACAVLAASASATFHEMSIREVFPGSSSASEAEYVELQMWAAGQNLVGGHSLRTYDAGGALIATTPFGGDVSGAANQSTVLLGTPAVTTAFGVTPDGTLEAGKIDPAGGAVCWESIDCVSWGGFKGLSLPSPAGSPAAPAGIPDGMAIRRTISPGCPTFLEPTDDRDNSAADFAAVFPSPRPNSVAPSETRCPSSAGQAGGEAGGGQDGQGARGAPQTTLKRKPPHKTTDRTPTFRFGADEQGSTFQCKLDGKPFKPCRSPFTAARLALGAHTFKVRARDESGKLDPTPAAYRFRIA